MEGTDTVGDIQIVLLLLLRNDIDGASQCICTQTGRYYSFINFNPVYDIDRQIRQWNTAAFCIQWYSVQKITYGITRHSIDGEVEVRANSAFLSHLNARCTVHQVVEVIQWVYYRLDVECIDSKGSFLHFLRLGLSVNLDRTQRYGTFLQCKVLFFILPDVEGLFHGLVAQEGDDEGMFTRSDLQWILPPVIRIGAGGGVFHSDGGLGYRCPVLVYDFSG